MIMYRNPLEAWFWEGGWFYVGTTILLLAGGIVLFENLSRAYRNWKYNRK